MKTQQVLELLGVSRATLSNYVKNGTIKAHELGNGRFEYDDASIYEFLRSKRHTAIYTSVSEDSDQEELNRRILIIRQHIRKKYGHTKIGVEYKDTATSALVGERPEFLKLMKDVVNYKVDKVFMYDRGDLDPLGFSFFKSLIEPLQVSIELVSKKKTIPKEASSLLQLIKSYYFDMEMSKYLRTQVRRLIMNSQKPSNASQRWDELVKELGDILERHMIEFESDEQAYKEAEGMLRDLNRQVVSKLNSIINSLRPKPEPKKPKLFNPENKPHPPKK